MKDNREKIVLIGNPNAGKTTLFNALTGRNEKIGNWHGVTVESVSGITRFNGEESEIVDVPGIYSLKNRAAEENAAADIIKKRDYDKIVVVTDASKLGRGIRLIKELRSLNVPIIVFINLYGDFLRRGGKLDEKKLAENLGAEVICGEAVGKADVEKLKEKIFTKQTFKRGTDCDFDYMLPKKKSEKLEKIVTGRFTALPVFAAIMIFCFWLSFGENSPVSAISGAISRLLNDFIGKYIYAALSDKNIFLARLITEGIIGGLSAVAEFIPQIAVLSLCTDFLDQSGYLSRISAVTDGVLRTFSLSGKSLYSLFCGFGCTAVSASLSKGIDDEKVKLRAVLSMPFITCSAKTPLYFFVAKAAFKNYAFLIIAAVYFLSLIFPLVHSLILSKTAVKGRAKPLIEEIAPLTFPKISTLSKPLLKTMKEFIIKLSSVVFTVTLAMWLAVSVSPSLRLLTQSEADKSILAGIGNVFVFAFKKAGFDWRMPSALLTGIFAKESVVSSFSLLFPEGLNLSVCQGLFLTAFCYLYTPCLTALSAMKKSIGAKYAIFAAVYQLALAFAAAYAVYFISGIFI